MTGGAREAGDAQVGGWLASAWAWISRIPTWLFVAWVGALLLARSGVRGGVGEELRAFARQFPQPGAGYRSNAVIGPALGYVTGLDGDFGWSLLHAVATGICFVVLALLLRRRTRNSLSWRVSLVWLSFCSLATSLLRFIGWYDVYTVTGAALVVLTRHRAMAVLGGAMLGSTNPEQGAALLVGAALVSWSLRSLDPADGRRAEYGIRTGNLVAGALGLVAARVAILVWFNIAGQNVQSRRELFAELLDDSLSNALSLGSVGIYSWLALGWVVVVWVVWSVSRRPAASFAAATGLVLIPTLATVTTLDGSRVFAAVSSGALLLALVPFADAAHSRRGKWIPAATAALMLFGLLVPAVASLSDGTVPGPWEYVVVDVLGLPGGS